MSHIEPNWSALFWFVPLWSVCCLGFFHLAGMYPISHRSEGGPEKSVALVLGNTLLWLVLLAGTIVFAYTELRWTTAVVVAGILFLFIPEAFQAMPVRWRDSRAGMAVAGGVMICAIAILAHVAADPIRALFV
ncbi:MAG: hypothetical protein K2W78_08220 [Xanthobacteraceae bacterium]|nr:hypothetical protein [Xanthobacteraceae bacterium]